MYFVIQRLESDQDDRCQCAVLKTCVSSVVFHQSAGHHRVLYNRPTDSSRWLALYQSPFRFYIFDRSSYVSIRVFVFEVSMSVCMVRVSVGDLD